MASKLTPELLEKAKQAKTAEELIALAKENGAEMTPEEANTYFAQLNPKTGELSDDELDNVAGGCGEDDTHYTYDGHPIVDRNGVCEYFRKKDGALVIADARNCESCYYCESGGYFICHCPAKRRS